MSFLTTHKMTCNDDLKKKEKEKKSVSKFSGDLESTLQWYMALKALICLLSLHKIRKITLCNFIFSFHKPIICILHTEIIQ